MARGASRRCRAGAIVAGDGGDAACTLRRGRQRAGAKALGARAAGGQPRKWIYGAIAAALVAFVAGGGAGWVAHGVAASPSTFQSFTLDALDAHRLYVVEVRHPVEVPGNERTHLQQWLTKRCGWTVHAPELDTTGLKLVGGRLLPGRSERASCRGGVVVGGGVW